MPETPITLSDAEALLALLPHAACVVDAEGAILWTNKAWQDAHGAGPCSPDETTFLASACADDASPLAAAVETALGGRAAEPVVVRCPCHSETEVWVEWRLLPYRDGRAVAWGRDVSRERRRGDSSDEMRLLEGEAEQIAGLGSWRLDLADGGLTWSPEMYRIFDVDPSGELDLAKVTATAIHPGDRAMLEEINAAVLADGVPRPARYRILVSDGSVRWVQAQGRQVTDAAGTAVALVGFVQDITDRVEAEEAQRVSEARYRSIINDMQDAYFRADLDGHLILANQAAARMYGFDSPADMIGIDAKTLYADEGERADVMVQLRREGSVSDRVGRGMRRDGSEFWVSLNVGLAWDENGAAIGTEGFARDVTERVVAEAALRESEEDLRDAQAIARIGSYVYDMGTDSWTSSETMDAIFGIDESYTRTFETWAALVHEGDREMMSRYFAEEVVGKRLPFDKEYRVTRADDGHTVWVHGHGRLEADDGGNPTRLVGAIQDVTQRHRGEKALRETNESLERMVYEVAEAMGRVIEIRDQYTKGHQERTARLAKALATEMGLAPYDVAAVEMAAVVHDIGKLSVPAEILTRPMRLSELEMSLVREHPRNGYEILKDIPFPWPVAQIVLEHHERMDGSGYPSGLRANEIAPLARVLTVADVVEAMATHRPYRPALGLDAALAELAQCSAKYDPTVVAACVRLAERGEIEL